MKPGVLSQYFSGVAAKRLSAVEARPDVSHQHEFNGVEPLKSVLGTERRSFPTHFMRVSDVEDDATVDDGFLTWYDARERHPTRSEYRLYFPSTAVSEQADAGDLLLVVRRPDDSILVVIAEAGSTVENQLLWLFGLSPGVESGFEVKEIDSAKDIELGFAARRVLEYIGVEVEEGDARFLDKMLDRFGGGFPTTSVFSAFARETLGDVSALGDADAALVVWLEREEVLFRTLERHGVGARIQQGFGDDVDEFVRYSLSVQNRRKSRAGYALENHLEHVLRQYGVRYSRGQVTENQARPDFIFPSIEEYHRETFPVQLLSMLGVKSTCKDRWRQVLSEARRITAKHLLTMEPGISENQTAEMRDNSLSLVVPMSLHTTYNDAQRAWLLTVQDFLALVQQRQTSAA